MYLALKHSHILLLLLSVSIFTIRFICRRIESKIADKIWMRVFPRIIDTCLLLTGLSLIYVTGLTPFSPGGEWLIEKFVCLSVYIGLGLVALKKNCGTLFSIFAFGGALGWLFLAVNIALTKTPYL